MPRKKGHGRLQEARQHANKKTSLPKDSSYNLSNPPNNIATIDTVKDPQIQASNQRKESSAINLNAALDENILDEIPLDELKSTTIDQRKKSPTIVASSERRKIWTKVTVRVHDEVSRLIPKMIYQNKASPKTRM